MHLLPVQQDLTLWSSSLWRLLWWLRWCPCSAWKCLEGCHSTRTHPLRLLSYVKQTRVEAEAEVVEAEWRWRASQQVWWTCVKA